LHSMNKIINSFHTYFILYHHPLQSYFLGEYKWGNEEEIFHTK